MEQFFAWVQLKILVMKRSKFLHGSLKVNLMFSVASIVCVSINHSLPKDNFSGQTIKKQLAVAAAFSLRFRVDMI